MNIKGKVDLESMFLKKLQTLTKSISFFKFLMKVLHCGEWDKYWLTKFL